MRTQINSQEAVEIARDFLDVPAEAKPEYVGVRDGAYTVLFPTIGLTVGADGFPGDEWVPDEYDRVRSLLDDVSSL